MHFFNTPLRELHIGITTRCKLSCSFCARTTMKETLNLYDLDLAVIRAVIDDPVSKTLEQVCLSGNYGDPIYHPQFIEMIDLLKSRNLSIVIETNGSHQDSAFWESLKSILDKKDTIIFSIDGLEKTNSLYRVGADWESISNAVSCLNSNPSLVWKYIVFSHNRGEIEKAKTMAVKWGMDSFLLVESQSFDNPYLNFKKAEKERLNPYRKESSIQNKTEQINQDFLLNKLAPKCLSGHRHYIEADGFYAPCCWLGQFKMREELKKIGIDTSLFDLKKRCLGDILALEELGVFEKLWYTDGVLKHLCKRFCPARSEQPNNLSVHKKLLWDLKNNV